MTSKKPPAASPSTPPARDELITTAIANGYVLIPIAGGSKRPLLPWAPYRAERPPATTMLEWFARWPAATPAILTGPLSGIIALDYDGGPYPNEGLYTQTPSGGRHYWYRYHPGDCHGLRVRPNIDIPVLALMYAQPQINSGRIPIQPTLAPQPPRSPNSFQESDQPSFHALKRCEFVKWFLVRRDDPTWDNRYALARAYAASARLCADPDLSLGSDYRHQEDIYDRPPPKPITCAQIVAAGYECSHFDPWRGGCDQSFNVTTPFGLATRNPR